MCGVKVVDVRQHAGSCVVMFQAALLQLIFSGGRDADEHPLQVDARGERCGRGGCGRATDPSCIQETEARSVQQSRIGQGPAATRVTGAKQPADLGFEDTSELREVVKKLGNMVLRNAETVNRIEYDACFLMQLSTKPHPGTVIPSMFKVAREWRKMREENPQALQQSLRQVMLLCLVKEVQARASLTLQTPAAGFLEGENWVYQTWDPAKKINVRDMTRAPLPVADFNTQAERLQKYVMGSGVTRFQALKQLTPDLEDQQIPFLLDVSLRDSFLHDLLLAWTQLSVFSLVGGRMRRSRIRQGPQQEQMYQMLRNL